MIVAGGRITSTPGDELTSVEVMAMVMVMVMVMVTVMVMVMVMVGKLQYADETINR